MTDKFTQKAIEALQNAQKMAIESDNMQIAPEHLTYSLADQDGGLIQSLLSKMGVDTDKFVARLDGIINSFPKVTGSGREPEKVYISPETDKILAMAEDLAKKNGDAYVSVEHIMLGILSLPTQKLKELFREFNISEKLF